MVLERILQSTPCSGVHNIEPRGMKSNLSPGWVIVGEYGAPPQPFPKKFCALMTGNDSDWSCANERTNERTNEQWNERMNEQL